MQEIESRVEPNHRKAKEDPRLKKEAQIRKLVRAKLKAIMEAKNGRSKRVAKVSKPKEVKIKTSSPTFRDFTK